MPAPIVQILATHDLNVAEHAHRTIRLRDGQVESDVRKRNKTPRIARITRMEKNRQVG